jgi:hypothetical protein
MQQQQGGSRYTGLQHPTLNARMLAHLALAVALLAGTANGELVATLAPCEYLRPPPSANPAPLIHCQLPVCIMLPTVYLTRIRQILAMILRRRERTPYPGP